MGKYFGTDGFRGEANKALTYDHAIRIGRYLGWYYGKRLDKKAKVVIGKDTRASSYMFEYALCAGLTASGADAYIMHVTTTPSVSYIARVDDFDCGIMISASHNPYYDNGIKIVNSHGEKMDEETLLRVEDYIDGKMELPMATRGEIGRTVDYVSGRNRYIGYLISLSKYSYKDMRVGLDVANGAAWSIARGVFDALGAKTYVINDHPDGYNINTDCGSTHIGHLQRFVVENRLDVGFAYDGDADRCIAVDENGHVVDGDLILYVCGRYMSKYGRLVKDTVVPTVMSNFGLFKAFDELGISVDPSDVGDRFVYAKMREEGYTLGGEPSGHVIFSELETTGDGIMTSLRVMEAIRVEKESLSTAVRPVKLYPQVLENVEVSDKKAAMESAELAAAIKQAEELLSGDGRILVRPSGTEELIRVMSEAPTHELCRQANAFAVEALQAFKA